MARNLATFLDRLMERPATACGVAISLLLVISILKPPPTLFLWNASASSPLGLYQLVLPGDLRRGDIIGTKLPPAIRLLAASRRYLPANVPLVKRVAAIPGDKVCAIGAGIWVNDHAVARRQRRDPSGRPMPWWSGCMTLRSGQILLVAENRPDAFDGRYFGPTNSDALIGKARLLWAI